VACRAPGADRNRRQWLGRVPGGALVISACRAKASPGREGSNVPAIACWRCRSRRAQASACMPQAPIVALHLPISTAMALRPIRVAPLTTTLTGACTIHLS
jgi:hypothetical protein